MCGRDVFAKVCYAFVKWKTLGLKLEVDGGKLYAISSKAVPELREDAYTHPARASEASKALGT
ncbi:hypothetical protein RSAG8_14012, partial [Rhizoctonia solani AG-8 WAC10335]